MIEKEKVEKNIEIRAILKEINSHLMSQSNTQSLKTDAKKRMKRIDELIAKRENEYITQQNDYKNIFLKEQNLYKQLDQLELKLKDLYLSDEIAQCKQLIESANDQLFEIELKKEEIHHFINQYKAFQLEIEKTKDEILSDCGLDLLTKDQVKTDHRIERLYDLFDSKLSEQVKRAIGLHGVKFLSYLKDEDKCSRCFIQISSKDKFEIIGQLEVRPCKNCQAILM